MTRAPSDEQVRRGSYFTSSYFAKRCPDLGEETLRAQAVEVTPAINPGGGPIDLFFTPEYETQGHIVRMGLNFKFGHRSRQPVPLK